MKKLIITIEENTEIAEQIVKKWQFFIYKRAYNALGTIIYAPLSKYEKKQDGNKRIYEQKGEDEYIDLQLKKFENFMFGDINELRKDKYRKYEKHLNDRWIQKVLRGANKVKNTIRNKAIKAALSGNDVLSFFTKMGYFVTWTVESFK